MSGVAIATALMHPLCTVGFGIATWHWQYIVGALYLFLINSILIALATFLAVKYLHYPTIQEQTSNRRRRTISITLAVVVLIVPSVMSAISVVRENNFSRRANAFIAQHKTIGTSMSIRPRWMPLLLLSISSLPERHSLMPTANYFWQMLSKPVSIPPLLSCTKMPSRRTIPICAKSNSSKTSSPPKMSRYKPTNSR